MKLSVIIKSLNEEQNIARCIESILESTQDLDCEIILVDSLSTDKTIEIASQYPISIIQFADKADASCGSAPQLGYQQSSGDFIYLIDGDMSLDPGFLKAAIDFILEDDWIAGVGGILVDTSIKTTEEIRRNQHYSKIQTITEVSSLGGGGLYRRSAIDAVRYFSHQSLKACEEAELGVRLRAFGWKLFRLPTLAIYHTGHKETVLGSLNRLWENGRLTAHGLFIKSALNKKWLLKVISIEWYIFTTLIINCSFFSISLYLYLSESSITLSIMVVPIGWLVIALLLTAKKKKFKTALISLLSWHIVFLAAAKGFFQPIKDPTSKINFISIKKLALPDICKTKHNPS